MSENDFIQDLETCAARLSDACARRSIKEISNLIAMVCYLRTRMTLHGILSFREIVDEEVRLVGLCSEPNVRPKAARAPDDAAG